MKQQRSNKYRNCCVGFSLFPSSSKAIPESVVVAELLTQGLQHRLLLLASPMRVWVSDLSETPRERGMDGEVREDTEEKTKGQQRVSALRSTHRNGTYIPNVTCTVWKESVRLLPLNAP